MTATKQKSPKIQTPLERLESGEPCNLDGDAVQAVIVQARKRGNTIKRIYPALQDAIKQRVKAVNRLTVRLHEMDRRVVQLYKFPRNGRSKHKVIQSPQYWIAVGEVRAIKLALALLDGGGE